MDWFWVRKYRKNKIESVLEWLNYFTEFTWKIIGGVY